MFVTLVISGEVTLEAGIFFTEFKFGLSSKSGCEGVPSLEELVVSAADRVASENKLLKLLVLVVKFSAEGYKVCVF